MPLTLQIQERKCHSNYWNDGLKWINMAEPILLQSSNNYIHFPTSACDWGTIFDAETKFGMFSSRLCEVFWERIEIFTAKHNKLLENFKFMIQKQAVLYAEAIREAIDALINCIWFVDCSKIRMNRPGGKCSRHRSGYNGRKSFNCLIYQTIKTPCSNIDLGGHTNQVASFVSLASSGDQSRKW